MKETICQCWDDEIPQYQKEGKAHCTHCKLPITTTKEQQTQEKCDLQDHARFINEHCDCDVNDCKRIREKAKAVSEASPEEGRVSIHCDPERDIQNIMNSFSDKLVKTANGYAAWLYVKGYQYSTSERKWYLNRKYYEGAELFKEYESLNTK